MSIRLDRFLFVTLALMLGSAGPIASQTKLPGGVVSRLTKIEGYLKNVETRLKSGSINRNDFDRAVEMMGEIKKSYPESASHPDVQAAEKRIAEVSAALVAAESGKQQTQAAAASAAKASEQVLVDWARRLAAYKTDSNVGSKGFFGATGNIDQIISEKKNYEAAKTLYDEFLQTGINKDDHFELRQAEYDIRVAILNYEQSRDRIPEEAAKYLDEAIAWMKARQAEGKTVALSRDVQARVSLLVEQSNLLFPGSDLARILNSKKAGLDKSLEEADRTILENRVMAIDVYKKPDAEEVRRLIRSVVMKEAPAATIVKVNITRPDWQRESVIEWTDTTKTATQHRVTDSLYSQVAVKTGSEIFLFTVYINKDTIGGKTRPATGHVMYKDRLLEKNIR
ncbi:MAG: hypothetical protein CVV51_07805 [Spirochaetae bacterium HGW-Spirochaetae-7]|jgi:hypothetical protein|nr:MAG: hypothetical protein CVV51_07805 [Spirochaetae bacterium HGW-Spirochaetae-7]